MPTKIEINGRKGGKIYRSRLSFIDLPGRFLPRVAFVFKSSVLHVDFEGLDDGGAFRRAYYRAGLVRITGPEPPASRWTVCQADFGAGCVFGGRYFLRPELDPEERAFVEGRRAVALPPKKPSAKRRTSARESSGHRKGLPPGDVDPTAAGPGHAAGGLRYVRFGPQEYKILGKSVDLRARVWRLVTEEQTFVLKPATLTRLELAEAFDGAEACLAWLPVAGTGSTTPGVEVNTGDRIFAASFDVVRHTTEERLMVAKEVEREVAAVEETIGREQVRGDLSRAATVGKSRPRLATGREISQAGASGVQPAPVPALEVDDAVLWHFWQKIQDELDRRHKRAPSASQVFVSYCRDRMTLRKMERQFGWKYRTIKVRKAELEALLGRHGYTLDRFIVDRSMFRAAEKQLADYRAKRSFRGQASPDDQPTRED